MPPTYRRGHAHVRGTPRRPGPPRTPATGGRSHVRRPGVLLAVERRQRGQDADVRGAGIRHRVPAPATRGPDPSLDTWPARRAAGARRGSWRTEDARVHRLARRRDGCSSIPTARAAPGAARPSTTDCSWTGRRQPSASPSSADAGLVATAEPACLTDSVTSGRHPAYRLGQRALGQRAARHAEPLDGGGVVEHRAARRRARSTAPAAGAAARGRAAALTTGRAQPRTVPRAWPGSTTTGSRRPVTTRSDRVRPSSARLWHGR